MDRTEIATEIRTRTRKIRRLQNHHNDLLHDLEVYKQSGIPETIEYTQVALDEIQKTIQLHHTRIGVLVVAGEMLEDGLLIEGYC
jgi:glutamate synthase domain-containing protein 1